MEQFYTIPITLSEELIRIIRMLAKSGKRLFHKFLYIPIFKTNNYKRLYSNEKTYDLIEKIKKSLDEPSKIQTIGPLCKRMIAQALTESESALGDACIFFLEIIMKNPVVASSKEAKEFIQIILPHLREFQNLYENQNKKIFEELLIASTREELKKLMEPVELDQYKKKIKISQEIKILMEKIKIAQRSNDISKIIKLLSVFLIRYTPEDLEEEKLIESIINSLEKKYSGFRKELYNYIAIQLHYQIIQGVVEKNLKKSIMAISKYTYIFKGNPEIKFYYEIDQFEKKLYEILDKKNLWKEFK